MEKSEAWVDKRHSGLEQGRIDRLSSQVQGPWSQSSCVIGRPGEGAQALEINKWHTASGACARGTAIPPASFYRGVKGSRFPAVQRCAAETAIGSGRPVQCLVLSCPVERTALLQAGTIVPG
jgi:hypothetical protein